MTLKFDTLEQQKHPLYLMMQELYKYYGPTRLYLYLVQQNKLQFPLQKSQLISTYNKYKTKYLSFLCLNISNHQRCK